MKKTKIFMGLALMGVLFVSFTNCNRDVTFHSEALTDQLKTGDIIVGNPLVSKMLLAKMCEKITACHPGLAVDSCSDGIMKMSGVEFQLGLPAGGVKTYSDIVQAEENGIFHPNQTAASTCAGSIESLSCADPAVQKAYNASSSTPFAGVAFMIPTLPGSCPAVFSQPVARAEYFVSPNGSDLNDGSAAKPWATITHASNALVLGPEGATVHVAPGNYTPVTHADCSGPDGYKRSCGVRTQKSGTSAAPIVYISDVTGGAKIIPSDADSAWYNSGDHVQIIGFEVVGNSKTNAGIQNDGSFVRVESNHVHHIPVALGCAQSVGGGGIIHSNEFAENIDSIGNRVHDIGPFPGNGLPSSSYCNHAHGIYHKQPRGNVQNNLIYRVGAWGVLTYANATEMQIANNLIYDSGTRDASNVLQGGAIALAATGTLNDTTVSNNIIRNNSGLGLADRLAPGNNQLYTNNIFYSNGRNFDLKSTSTSSGSLFSDPRMVDFRMDGTGDYRLQAGSPAIDAGSSNCARASGPCISEKDYSGFLRSYGASIDIGPFERHP